MLADGLGDTIRVSLTEDPEFELEPCKTLAALGDEACSDAARALAAAVPAYDDSETRDVSDFVKREVVIPSTIYSDEVHALHRDGSVIASVTLDQLDSEQALYAALGCATAVGMPFREVATVDSIFLDGVPGAKETDRRRVIKRLQQAGLGVLVDGALLRAEPLAGAIAVEPLAFDFPPLPEGCVARVAKLTGLESEDLIASLKTADVGFALLDVDNSNLSRLHASRRVVHIVRELTRVSVNSRNPSRSREPLRFSVESLDTCWTRHIYLEAVFCFVLCVLPRARETLASSVPTIESLDSGKHAMTIPVIHRLAYDAKSACTPGLQAASPS